MEDFYAYIGYEKKTWDKYSLNHTRNLYERAVTIYCTDVGLWDNYITFLVSYKKRRPNGWIKYQASYVELIWWIIVGACTSSSFLAVDRVSCHQELSLVWHLMGTLCTRSCKYTIKLNNQNIRERKCFREANQ